MEPKRQPGILKLFPSFADLAFLMPMVFLFGRMNGFATLLSDCDTGWHIRTGEWILANRLVPRYDIFSFSKPGDPWFAWEWLADVFFAWLNGLGGLRLVAFFCALLISVTFLLVFRLVRRKASPIVAIAVTIVAMVASSIHWLARPHLFTLLFLVVFYAALESMRQGRKGIAGVPYLAILPALTILWTNLHGGFVAGIILMGAYGIGEALKGVFSPAAGGWMAGWKAARPYIVCALACLAASLVNPYFYHLHAHMAIQLHDPYSLEHIQEWFSPSFHNPLAMFVEALLVLGAGAAFWSVAKGRFIEPVALVLWAHAALSSARNVPIYAIVAAPIVAGVLQEWMALLPESSAASWFRGMIQKFNRMEAQTLNLEGVRRFHLVSAAGVALILAIVWAPNPPKKFRAEFDPDRYPSGALATLRGDTSARIFTHDEWGDYLIWSLYPKQKVFLDGRNDFYGDAFEEQCADVLNVKYGWEKFLGRLGVDTILMPPNTPLSGALKESNRWQVVYDDGVAVVFRSRSEAVGRTVSSALAGGEVSRDREVTKTQASDRAITETKSKT